MKMKKSSERKTRRIFYNCIAIYETGGSGSLLDTSSGFLRRVKKPTAMGIKIKMKEKQSIAMPAPAGIVPELLTPFNSVVYGMLPVAVTAPNIHKNKPGHPHNKAVAIVAIMPVFLFIFISSDKLDLHQYTTNKNGMQAFLHPIGTGFDMSSTTQPSTS